MAICCENGFLATVLVNAMLLSHFYRKLGGRGPGSLILRIGLVVIESANFHAVALSLSHQCALVSPAAGSCNLPCSTLLQCFHFWFSRLSSFHSVGHLPDWVRQQSVQVPTYVCRCGGKWFMFRLWVLLVGIGWWWWRRTLVPSAGCYRLQMFCLSPPYKYVLRRVGIEWDEVSNGWKDLRVFSPVQCFSAVIVPKCRYGQIRGRPFVGGW